MGEITQKIVLPETFQGVRDELAGQFGMMWELIKAPLMVLLLRLGVYICLAMSLMLFCERLYMGIVIILVKLFWKKPEKRCKYETIQEDVEMGSSNFLVVLIQIPMYNERDVQFLCFFYFISLCFDSGFIYCFFWVFCDLPLGFSFSGFTILYAICNSRNCTEFFVEMSVKSQWRDRGFCNGVKDLKFWIGISDSLKKKTHVIFLFELAFFY